jgi:hypothetical protein
MFGPDFDHDGYGIVSPARFTKGERWRRIENGERRRRNGRLGLSRY